ncbi:MAG: hypothetical protein JWN24_3924 [Phycisphaerales bacterium]|nr:hypothetical protein [Phycisphaerales bacterium]
MSSSWLRQSRAALGRGNPIVHGLNKGRTKALPPRTMRALRSAARMEALEDRRLFTLLGIGGAIPIQFPQVFGFPTGDTLTYAHGTQHFDIADLPLLFQPGPDSGGNFPDPSFISAASNGVWTSEIHLVVSNVDGSLIGGNPSHGPDLLVVGSFTYTTSGTAMDSTTTTADGTITVVDNGDGTVGTTYDGTLLDALIVQNPPGEGFGFSNPGDSPAFDFRLTPQPGALLDGFFTNKDIGVVVNVDPPVSPGSAPPFNGTFTSDFSGQPKAVIGPIDKLKSTVKVSPAVVTTASETSGGVVGTALLSDSAVLSGGTSPTGSITFTLKAPDGGTADSETFPVVGNGTYSTSNPVIATQVGTYIWSASYSGDAQNNGTVDNGAGESLTTVKASPAISTVASPGGVVGSTLLSDSVTVSGGDSPAGTVIFTLTAPDSSTSTQTVTFSGDGTYTTPIVLATQVGTYSWSASYGGDALNNGATDNGANESVTTVKAGPSISTTPTPTVVTLGTTPPTLIDAATLSGGFNPTGTIIFTLYNGSNVLVDTETVTVNGNGTYTTPTGYMLPTAGAVTGAYQWDATYSGDANNFLATDNNNQAERVTVSPASPAIVTTPGPTVVIGSGAKLTDMATLSGGYFETGLVTFTLYGPANQIVDTETVPANGNGTYVTPIGYLPTAAGTYQWVASYGGDANNSPVSGTIGQEPEAVTPAGPTLVTTASPGGIVSSTVLTDSATLSGGYNETGTITFTLTSPGNMVVDTESVAVSGNGTYSTPAGFAATQVGIYTWHAVYSGDSNNQSANDPGGLSEQATIIKASPALITQASEVGSVVGSAQLSDTATLIGGYNHTGTITFTLTAPDGIMSPVGSVTVTAAGTYASPTVTATEVGTYTWHASYSGDGLNNGTIDNGQNESVTTVKASPSINTFASAGGVVGSTTLTDTATISGGYSVHGSITFILTQPDGSTVTEAPVPVAGNGTYIAPVPVAATQVGIYTWHAVYSGDGLNNGTSDNGANESATITKASPSISTIASETLGGVVGSAILSDTVTVAGGYGPTGTIFFSLTKPDGTTASAGSVAISGDGTYNAPQILATEVGTYTWHASYAGDTLNNGAVDNGANESLTTIKATPSISTIASETAGGVVGASVLSDSATIAGGYGISGGSITFTLTPPTGPVLTFTPVPVNGPGIYSAPMTVTATQVGTYTWHAVYSGDGLNNGAFDNGSNESLTTVKASPSISTHASENGNVVGSALLSDSATLLGGFNDTGTITFTLTAPDNTTSTVGSVIVTAAGTFTSPTVTATEVGTYTWHAVYTGDGLNNGAFDNGVNESVATVKATPALVTTASLAVTLGTTAPTLSDSAVLSGGYLETGSIVFTLTGPGGFSYTQTDTVSGNGTYTAGTTLPTTGTVAGTYTWTAVYSGDASNKIAADQGGAAEQTVVSPAKPAINTVPGGTVGLGSGAKLTDTATLSGGFYETGSVTFYLFAPGVTPNATYSNNVYSDTVTVAGNNTYTTAAGTNPGGYSPTVAGTYQWVAVYSGNANNIGITSPYGSEPESATASISGTVFCDNNLNGTYESSGSGDTLEGGAVVTLTNTSTHVTFTATTANGSFSIAGLPAGTYTLVLTTPSTGHTIELPHGINPPQSYTITVGANNTGYNFAEVENGSISGLVFLDINDSGNLDTGDVGIAGATVTLTGNDYLGHVVTKTLTTDSAGKFSFTGLLPSSSTGYTTVVTPPAGDLNGIDTVGTLNGSADGAWQGCGTGTISNIVLPGCNNDAINYKFGELGIFHGLTATIGFWHNQNGQAVLKSFGTTSNGLTLANWLATTMPNLFGKNAPAFNVASTTGTNLTNRSDSDVAAYFLSLFGASGQKSYAQVLATAFAVFTTTNSLDAGSASRALALKYGFILSNTGAGAATFAVPQADWAAFGITSSSSATKTIAQLLLAANNNAVAGKLNGGNTTLINETNDVFNTINNRGDIGTGMALVTSESGAYTLTTDSLGHVFAGTYLVQIDPNFSPDEVARIEDAINNLDLSLSKYGVVLAEMPQDITASPDIDIHYSDTSSIGGMADGVLGVTELGGHITIINGWDYYLGSDPAGVVSGQYDFQTVVTHELGHSLGLGHSTDTNSVMYPALSTGEARRSLTSNDLAMLDNDVEPAAALHAVVPPAIKLANDHTALTNARQHLLKDEAQLKATKHADERAYHAALHQYHLARSAAAHKHSASASIADLTLEVRRLRDTVLHDQSMIVTTTRADLAAIGKARRALAADRAAK